MSLVTHIPCQDSGVTSSLVNLYGTYANLGVSTANLVSRTGGLLGGTPHINYPAFLGLTGNYFSGDISGVGNNVSGLTVACWVRNTNLPAAPDGNIQPVFNINDVSGNVILRLQNPYGTYNTIRLDTFDSNQNQKYISCVANTTAHWIHYLATLDYNNNVLNLYINGIRNTGSNTGGNYNSLGKSWSNYYVGGNSGNLRITGDVFDFRIYDNFTTEPIARQIYKDAFAPNRLHGHWPMQDSGANPTVVNLVGPNASYVVVDEGANTDISSTGGPNAIYTRSLSYNINNSSAYCLIDTSGLLRNVRGFTFLCWNYIVDNEEPYRAYFCDVRPGVEDGFSPSRFKFFRDSYEGQGSLGCELAPGDGPDSYYHTTINNLLFQTGYWAHFAVSVDYFANSIKFYVNGVEKAGTTSIYSPLSEFTSSGATPDTTSAYAGLATDIFSSLPNDAEPCRMADARFYHGVLESGSIYSVFTNGTTGDTEPPVFPPDTPPYLYINGISATRSDTTNRAIINYQFGGESQTVSSDELSLSLQYFVDGVSNTVSASQGFAAQTMNSYGESNTQSSASVGLANMDTQLFGISNTISKSDGLANMVFMAQGESNSRTIDVGTIFLTPGATGGAGNVVTGSFNIYNDFVVGHTFNHSNNLTGSQNLGGLYYINGRGGVYNSTEISGIYKLYNDRFHSTHKLSNITGLGNSVLLSFVFNFTSDISIHGASVRLFNNTNKWYTDNNVVVIGSTLQYQFYPTTLGYNLIQPVVGDWVGPIYQVNIL